MLVATVKRWNSDLREKGIDTEYGRTLTADPNMKAVFVGRDVKSWSAPIEEGPFYAVKLVPVTYHTMGGPKKSVKAEVLDPFGEPIPRLYVAGELGSTWGLTYQGACANADAEESRERTRLLWKTGSNFLMLVSPEGLRYFFRAVYFLLMQESFCIALSSRVLGLSVEKI